MLRIDYIDMKLIVITENNWKFNSCSYLFGFLYEMIGISPWKKAIFFGVGFCYFVHLSGSINMTLSWYHKYDFNIFFKASIIDFKKFRKWKINFKKEKKRFAIMSNLQPYYLKKSHNLFSF